MFPAVAESAVHALPSVDAFESMIVDKNPVDFQVKAHMCNKVTIEYSSQGSFIRPCLGDQLAQHLPTET